MFGLGIWEIGVIVVVVLILFKPEDIPKLLRNFGRVSRQLKDLLRSASSTVSDMGREFDGRENESDPNGIGNVSSETKKNDSRKES